jgi:hypothetical protein
MGYRGSTMNVTSIARWKKIDIMLPHQEKAKKLIMSRDFEAPSRKTLRKVFGEKGQR